MTKLITRTSTAIPTVRCAIYTRKSTEEGLNQEFNSLDAQRESAEAFIASQQAEGWICLPERYDDGGCTGANLDRPALARLLADIATGQVNGVVVYKVDRLSRSLLDFARLMETFDKYGVAFICVTQPFNTATSMGRLVLNVLLSFAQFEREIIAERTRDKIAATKRKGKWSGGRPLLGYDLDPRERKLVVNVGEAEQVRGLFALYLEHQALGPVVQELAQRCWVHKRWVSRAGVKRGGQPFTVTSLYRLLRQVAYVGQVRYRDEVHAGEHPALVEPRVWRRVQALLRRSGSRRKARMCGSFGALLAGRLYCVPCGCAMVATSTTRQGNKRYGYYVCRRAQKRGWHTCPSKSLPAAAIEQFVVEQIRGLGEDPAMIRQLLIGLNPETDRPELAAEDVASALAAFAAKWETLPPQEQALILPQLVERVNYDGATGQLALTFHVPNLLMLVTHKTSRTQENAP